MLAHYRADFSRHNSTFMNSYVRIAGILCLLVRIYVLPACAQERVPLTIAAADQLFLSNNLDILAAQLNISAQKAAEIQARLYPNPVISGELNAWDPENRRVFNTGSAGEKILTAEQLIILGSKRRNEIELAKQSTAVAALELEDLLRGLRQQLHSSMYSVYFDEITLTRYDIQLQMLDTLIAGYTTQVQKGNISPRELVRLKAVYLNLNNEKTELLQALAAEQQTLRLLLRQGSDIMPVVTADSIAHFRRLPASDSLLEEALQHRPDLKIAALNTDIAALNLKYQKSLAIPDLTIGGGYDQAGGAFANQVNLTLGMPLPLWHRNQGNVRAARTQIELAGIRQEMSRNMITAEVTTAYSNMARSLAEYRKSQQMYNADFREVFSGIADNFRKRNISIVEFVDFFESYVSSVAAINRIRKQVALCGEQLNYVTGIAVYE